jgi:hypothetical protein
MPIRRFRSVEEMKAPPWRERGTRELFDAIAALLETGRRTMPRRFPPGVHRHRSIDELDRQVDAWQQADVDRLRAERPCRPRRG